MSARMRVLTVMSSSNQMYSGIGRAVFELTRRLMDRIQFEFAIDDLNPRNVEIVRLFAEAREIPLHLGRGRKNDECLDNGNLDLASLLRTGTWDAIECLCWANADTNTSILENIGQTTLIFTPHHQPSWTVPMSPEQIQVTEAVYHKTLRRSDLVLCDSPWERREVGRLVPGLNHASYLPLGCDFRVYPAGKIPRQPQLLFVGDLAEPRKRFDRVLSLMERLLPEWPELRLMVIGNRSETAYDQIPESLRGRCVLRGYTSEEELRTAYAESLGLVLLSEFEAFGIPILESLACGTPVFLSDLAPTRSLFQEFSGAYFCPAEDSQATAGIVRGVLKRGDAAISEAIADRSRLRSRFDWDRLAVEKWMAISASWFRKNGFSWAA